MMVTKKGSYPKVTSRTRVVTPREIQPRLHQKLNGKEQEVVLAKAGMGNVEDSYEGEEIDELH